MAELSELTSTAEASENENLTGMGRTLDQIYNTAKAMRINTYNSFATQGSGFNGIIELAKAYATAQDQCEAHNAHFDRSLLSNMYGRLLAVTLWHAAHQGLDLDTLMVNAFSNSCEIADMPCECMRCESD